MQYVAFLRGINVGGNTLVKMNELKEAFTELGCSNIKTVLASGNVIFTALDFDQDTMQEKICQKLQEKFGLQLLVVLRTCQEIQSLILSQPYKNLPMTPTTKRHVSFFSQIPANTIPVPYTSPTHDFWVVAQVGSDICGMVDLASGRGTTEYMNFIEKNFGKEVTTRTWQTVEKIGKLLEVV